MNAIARRIPLAPGSPRRVAVIQPSLQDGTSSFRNPTLERVGYSQISLREMTAIGSGLRWQAKRHRFGSGDQSTTRSQSAVADECCWRAPWDSGIGWATDPE